MMDSFHFALFGANIKRATGSNQEASYVDTSFATTSDHCFDHIPCLETLDFFHSFRFRTRKANIGDITLPPTPGTSCCDNKRYDSGYFDLFRGTRADTGCIDPMVFWQPSDYSIIFGQTARATFY